MRCLAIGLGCLLSVTLASRAWADEAAGDATAPEEAGDATAPEEAGEPLAPEEAAVTRPEPQRISGAITTEPEPRLRLIIPPYMRDLRGPYRTTALFPFFFERKGPAYLERLILPYYYRRSEKLDADVALGLIWSLRGPDRNTVVVPPFYYHRDKRDWGLGLFPLFSTGIFSGHHHTVIPPLLTWIDGDDETRRTVIGPYYDWKGKRAHWRGLFPLIWDKKGDLERITLVPPVFFRFTDEEPLRRTTVVPPFYYRKVADGHSWGLPPLVFRNVEPTLRSTTIPLALFHHARGPKEFRFVSVPLTFVENERQGRLWVTPIYQHRRGDRNLDAVGPVFFRMHDTRDESRGLVLAPVFWHFSDPANDSLVIFPFMGRWFHEGISSTWVMPLAGRYKSFERDEQTWWVFPTFEYGWTEDSEKFNIHPLLYSKRSPQKTYLAIAPIYFNFRNHEAKTHRFTLFPLYWDFQNFEKKDRGIALFPLYWDFRDGKHQTHRSVFFPLYWDFKDKRNDKRTIHALPLYTRWMRGGVDRQLILNSYYEVKREPGQPVRWQYHFFPFFSRGGAGEGRWWEVFYGLAGYDRRGAYRRAKVFWVPFQLGK